MAVAYVEKIQDQYGISEVAIGAVHSAMLLAYAICMTPGGWFIDRYGPREAAELILLVSYYNMVSRFLESTRVQLEDEPVLEGQTLGATTRRSAEG